MRKELCATMLMLPLLVASSHVLAQTSGCNNQGALGSSQQVVGTLLGAAVGGLLGSQIGGGTGNKIAIGAGVLAGGLLGNNVGSSMSCADQMKHGQTAQQAFETQPAGTTRLSSSPRTLNSRRTSSFITSTFSPTWTERDGFTFSPPISTLPPLQASAAALRVLTTRTAQSQRSIRTLSNSFDSKLRDKKPNPCRRHSFSFPFPPPLPQSQTLRRAAPAPVSLFTFHRYRCRTRPTSTTTLGSI